MINLKRLSIDELNQLASNIIDELNERDIETEDLYELEELDKFDIAEKRVHNLIDKFNNLIEKRSLIDDELERLDIIIDEAELKLDDMIHDLKIGIDV